MEFLAYSIKSSVCLVVFFLFFKMFLSHETFHRLNRVVLLASATLAVVLPLCVITVHRVADMPVAIVEVEHMMAGTIVPSAWMLPDWATLLMLLFVLGAVATLGRMVYATIQVKRLILSGVATPLGDGYILVLLHGNHAPFSWWRYVVMSATDFAENGNEIVAHERAHLQLHHSFDLLLIDLLACVQWFNPAVWLLRRELQAIHEYEADMAVINSGIDATKYQLLLVKKAAGGRWYSIANSLNHSELKNRVTMMLQKKSSKWAGLKALYVLPLIGIALTAFARNVYSYNVPSKVNENVIGKQAELRVDAAKSQFSIVGAELEGTTPSVRGNAQEERAQPAQELVFVKDSVCEVAEEQPEFPGGRAELLRFLTDNIKYPESAKKDNVHGKVIMQFIVEKDGTIKDIKVLRSPSPVLDEEAIRVIKTMPKWMPGKNKGVTVRVRFTLPIDFKLSKTT